MDKREFKRLLDTPRNLLTGLDRQRQFLLTIALHRSECIHPECDRLLSQFDACEQGFEGYQLGTASTANTFRCPDCKTPLAIVVPFVSTGAGWHWGKVRIPTGAPQKKRSE
jgi:hypothetical protein